MTIATVPLESARTQISDREPVVLWEITAIDADVIRAIFYAVTDTRTRLPDVERAYTDVCEEGAGILEIISVRRVERMLTPADRLPAPRVISHPVSDQRFALTCASELGL